MDDLDDDFGDLYTDVEAQASSSINGVLGFSPFLSEYKGCIANARDHQNHSSGDEDGFGSESEDDLNIVLNAADCENKSFAVEERENVKTNENFEDDFPAIDEFKCVSAHGSSNPISMKANLGNSMLATNGWNQNNVRGLCKGSISDQGALASASRTFGACQRRKSLFTLPRYRSILDVNIDAFEVKPWNHPGVDITDFFNFGFNEDSWKQYCNSVDHFRLSGNMRLGNLNHDSGNQVFEDGSKYEEKFDDAMGDNVCQPKGRAIQVRESIFERQPTLNAWYPRDRDYDVVIQINLEDTSDAGEKIDNSDGTLGNAPVDRELDFTDEERDFHRCKNRSEDEFSGKSLKDIDNRKERCSSRSDASNLITVDPTDTEENPSHNIEDSYNKKSFASVGIIPRESDLMNACCASQSVVDKELSCEEEDQLSLVSSCFESDSEVSEDGSHPDSAKISSPTRRSSVISDAKLWKSDASHRKNLRNFAKIKPVDYRDYSKCKSPVHFDRKHWRRKVDNNTENVDDRNCLSVSFGGQKEKLNDVGYRDREDIVYHEKSELFTSYDGGDFAKNLSHRGFKIYRKWSFHEEREDQGREGYWHRSVPFHQGMRHEAYEEAHRRSSGKNNKFESMNSTNYGSQFLDHELTDVDFIQEREGYARSISVIEQRRDTLDEFYDRRLRNFGDGLPRRTSYNDHLELESSWSRKVDDQYWGNVDAPYLSHRQSDQIEEEYWDSTNAHHPSHHFYRGSDGGRWIGQISPKNGISLSRYDKTYMRQYLQEDEESGRFDDYEDQHNFDERFIHSDNQYHFRRMGGSSKRSEAVPLTDEPIITHLHEKLHGERLSLNSRSNQRHRRDYSSPESLHDVMHINYMNSNQHGNRTTRNGSNSRSIRTNKFRVEYKQQFPEFRDSVDFNIGNGKLSVQCHKDRNSRFSRANKDPDEKIIYKDVDEPTRYKAVRCNLPKIYNCEDEKSQEQFPVLAQDDGLELEEGQILADELYTRPMDRADNVKKRMPHDDSASHGSKTGGPSSDDPRILETLAKMEKRRERFKESIIALKIEEDSCSKPGTVTVNVDPPHTMQHRPARKRQWCAR